VVDQDLVYIHLVNVHLLLGMFTKLGRATISFVLFVRPSAMDNLALSELILM
jgi:hypothetical protein